MNVGIAGLGLIGGSFAKAYTEAGHTVFAFDKDRTITDFAIISGAVSAELNKDNTGSCELILICTYPKAAADYLEQTAPFIGNGAVVIDCCGTKRVVVEACMKIAEKYPFTYIGGHPMAGKQYSGFKYSQGNLFRGAPMVIVPPTFEDIELLDRVKKLLEPAGFKYISVTTADEHDRMIAFTSQLAHVISNAYIKSPTAERHKGLSAGSYKDMTRVAWLNPEMWAELFMENRDYLMGELDMLITRLNEYRDAMNDNDIEKLTGLLEEGKRRKEEVDG